MSEKTWPELGQELARKAVEVLHDRLFKHSDGQISTATMFEIADALYDSVAGLVDWEVADMIYAVRNELKKQLRDETERSAST